MSPAEMHALEKAAMDDPFLADALEGYSKLKNEPTEDIALLNKRITARSHGAAVVPIKRNYWWRVAALILLIAGLGTVAFFLNNPENAALSKNEVQSETAATVDSTPRSKDASAEQTPPSSDFSKTEKSNESNVSVKKRNEPSVARNQVEKDFASDSAAAIEGYAARADDDAKTKDAPMPSAVSGASVSKGDTMGGRQARQQENVERSVTPQGNYLNYFSGKVVDAQNRSIPFATIRMANANQVAAADQNGYFQFKSRDSVAEISVSSAGYRERNVVMNSNQEALNITLAPLNEKGKFKEIQPKSTAKKAANFGDEELGTTMDAEPVIGWDKFNLYLDSNKRIPTSEPRINGEVVLSFKVNQKGELSAFEIERSMSKAYNNEAIRLVKQGPAWRVIKGKKTKVKVTVKF